MTGEVTVLDVSGPIHHIGLSGHRAHQDDAGGPQIKERLMLALLYSVK